MVLGIVHGHIQDTGGEWVSIINLKEEFWHGCCVFQTLHTSASSVKWEGCLPGRVTVKMKQGWSTWAAWHHAWHREGAQLRFMLKASSYVPPCPSPFFWLLLGRKAALGINLINMSLYVPQDRASKVLYQKFPSSLNVPL